MSSDVERGDGSIAPDAYWLGVIWAARREWGDCAKSLLLDWSKQSPRYEEQGFEHAWAQFQPNHPDPVTMASVYSHAREIGWVRPAAIGRYRLLDRAGIMALQELEWRVKGVFPTSGIAAIYGPSGSGKSFLVLDLALCIAAGEPWFGRKTAACPVTYVMLEGEAGLRNRITAWERANAREVPVGFFGVPQTFAFSDADDVDDLAEALPRGGVVIVDTLNRAAPGKDENSSKDMGEVLAGMKKLQELTGGLVLVVHHTGKDASKGMRGHSSLYAALDGAIEVKRDKAARSWSLAKAKDGSDDLEVPFCLDEVALGRDRDGELITSCVARPDLQRIFAPKEPTGKNQKAALAAIRAQPVALNREAALEVIITAFGGMAPNRRSNEARQQLDALLEAGHLTCNGSDLISARL
jgi:RecA/RadA recombinase